MHPSEIVPVHRFFGDSPSCFLVHYSSFLLDKIVEDGGFPSGLQTGASLISTGFITQT